MVIEGELKDNLELFIQVKIEKLMSVAVEHFKQHGSIFIEPEHLDDNLLDIVHEESREIVKVLNDDVEEVLKHSISNYKDKITDDINSIDYILRQFKINLKSIN